MDRYYLLVVDALTKASSQNPELIKLAEEQLKCLESESGGYYSTLMNVVLDKSVDVNIRWLASVCLKNGVDRFWRPSAPNAISVDEKRIIKEKLLVCFYEPVNQVAAQIALIISKVARIDCPDNWPELFQTLSSVLQLPEDLPQQRGLLVMHHVVKTLSCKRLPNDRRTFQMLTGNIFSNALQLWINYSTIFLQEAKNVHTNHKLLLEKCFFCLKILRKLVVYGFKDPSKEPDAVNFLSLIFQQFRPFLECRRHMLEQESLLETCEKYLILLAKVLRDVLELHPFAFVQFIRSTLECAVTFCFTEEWKGAMFERLTVQLLNLIKAILLCQEYRTPYRNENIKNPLSLEAHTITAEFFTYPVLKEIAQLLVTRYFVLSDEDIKNWEENPEEFATDEVGESWKFSLRPCTEVLFVSLCRKFKVTMRSLIVDMIREMESYKSVDFPTILKKEAIYNSVGLASFELYDDIDFDKWFTDVLIPELRLNERNYYIIRRRIMWVIGQWVSEKMSAEIRTVLYELILQMLRTEENLVVRLAAANTLKCAVDVEDYQFNIDSFLPFLGGCYTELFNLLKEVKECDLKMSVLHVMSFVIERVGFKMRPHVNSLMHYLPLLWDTCGEHNLLRCAIISCFVQIVQCLGSVSENLQPFLLPMIAFSTDVSLPPHVYLLEDGLELWSAVIENTSKCSSALLDLAQNLLPILEFGSENLRKCLQIVDAYILLSPTAFLGRYGQSLVKMFTTIMTDLNWEGITHIMRVVESGLIVFPMESPILFKPILSFALSLVLENEEMPAVLSVYLSVLSRVILHNQNCFCGLLQEKAEQFKEDVSKIFADLLDIWFELMPNASPQETRKLLGLALACLLTSGSGVVQYRIAGVILAVVEVLNDITHTLPFGDDPTKVLDSLVLEAGDVEEDEVAEEAVTEHDKRIRELSRKNPAYTVALLDYLRSQLNALEQSVGLTKFQDLMSTIDVETMQQLRKYLQH